MEELTDQQINVLIEATDLTKFKILEWYKDFKDYVKENGTLNLPNFVKFYSAILKNQGDSDEYCRLVFKAFDKDGSGSIGKLTSLSELKEIRVRRCAYFQTSPSSFWR